MKVEYRNSDKTVRRVDVDKRHKVTLWRLGVVYIPEHHSIKPEIKFCTIQILIVT